MPRLQILQHKSYHPYLEKNKQRVREDEAKARAEEAENEQRRIDSESGARLDALRRRAGSPSFVPTADEDPGDLPSTSSSRDKGDSLLERHRKAKARAEKQEKKKKDRLDFEFPSETARREERRKGKEKEKEKDIGRAVVDSYDVDENGREAVKWETNGHVNLFADLEAAGDGPSLGDIAKTKVKVDQKADPFTMYLARPDKETKPWYTDRELKKVEEKETGEEAEIRRERDKRKDKRSKDRHDPLTHINSLLSKHPHPQSSHRISNQNHSNQSRGADPHSARIAREQSERQRALALIAKSKAPASNPWDNTPSSVGGDRSWIDSFEREKDRAGQRFFGNGNGSLPHSRGAGRIGRSWEV